MKTDGLDRLFKHWLDWNDLTNRVHESAYISAGVELGIDVTIGPFVTILGPCQIADSVWIGANSVIGAPPEITDSFQNAAWDGEIEHAGVVIESNVVIREGVIIHQGTLRPTVIRSGSWLLNRAYVAHDVEVSANCIISAGVSVGGHCVIGEGANIGMNVSIHQRRVIGAGAMVGMGTPVTKDLPPFVKAFGNPIRIQGANNFILRNRISEPTLTSLVEDAINQFGYDFTHAEMPPEIFELLPELRAWERHIRNGT